MGERLCKFKGRYTLENGRSVNVLVVASNPGEADQKAKDMILTFLGFETVGEGELVEIEEV